MTPRPPLPRRTPQGSPPRSANVPVPPIEWRTERAGAREALEARDALATALSRAGIQLPAMDVRTPWADVIQPLEPADPRDRERDAERRGEVRYALVHLGVCSAPVAQALAAVVVKGTGR